MRAISLFLLSLFALASCQPQQTKKASTSLFNKGVVIIEGQIDNAPDKQVDLHLEELTGRKTYTSKTDSTGHFRFEVETLSEHDNVVWFDKEYVAFYLKPGDSVFIQSDLKTFRESMQISGDNVSFNKLINKYEDVFTDELLNTFFKKKKGATPHEFKKVEREFIGILTAHLDSVVKIIEPSAQELKWMKRYVLYREFIDLLAYKGHYDGDLPHDFFMKEGELFTAFEPIDLTHSGYYDMFLRHYYTHIVFYNESGGYDIENKFYGTGSIESVRNYFDLIEKVVHDEYHRNHAYKMAIDNLIFRQENTLDSAYVLFKERVKDSVFLEEVRKSIRKIKEPKVKNIYNLKSNPILGDVFTDIQQKCQGKIVYVDVWTSWCGGCVTGLPYTTKLREKFEGKEVETVFLCAASKREDFERIKNEKHLLGLHYFLDKEQTDELERLELYGTPRYFMAGKDGGIVDHFAKDPFAEEELTAEIESLLK